MGESPVTLGVARPVYLRLCQVKAVMQREAPFGTVTWNDVLAELTRTWEQANVLLSDIEAAP